MEVNSRVGAILSLSDGTAKFLGYGTYVGNHIPEDCDKGSFLELLKEQGISNPKIVLDNGKIVWGCDCWWGSEQQVEKYLKSAKKIINVDLRSKK